MIAKTRFTRTRSPLGTLLLVGEADGDRLALRGLYFDGAPHSRGVVPEGAEEDAAAFADVVRQLEAYFDGARTSFDVALAPRGTAFQREVWRALTAIPYGETTTYAAIATAIGAPRASRAVGAANGRNPLSIIVPCHRVIGGDGALTGYAGGTANKRALLALEAASAIRSSRGLIFGGGTRRSL